MPNSLPLISYRPLRANTDYRARFENNVCQVEAKDSDHSFVARVEVLGHALRLQANAASFEGENSYFTVRTAMEYLFGHIPEIQTLAFSLSPERAEKLELVEFFDASANEVRISREEFFQLPELWHCEANLVREPEIMTRTEGRPHPVRNQNKTGTFYSRYVPDLGQTISFRGVDAERDLDLFHAWHNDPRVYDLWELNKSKEELRVYLEKGFKDPHQIPMILEMGGVPAGYFEVYWAAEDRIGPYYEYAPYDRGFHFLIGDPNYLGVRNTDAVLRSVVHFIYLDDPRTRRIVAEPRSDNKRVIKYVQIVPGWKFIKEFDFPHKRAALLMHFREDFFAKGAL